MPEEPTSMIALQKHTCWMFVALTLALASTARGQSITIAPAHPSVAVEKSVQFSAQLSGLSGSVTWSAGGIVGGNSIAGQISSTGLYTAPASLPRQNPVQIIATSVTSSVTKATTYVYLLSNGPTIASISPDPLTVGTLTIVIHGSGFEPGATIFESSGKSSLVQLTTKSMTSTEITATSYQGPASSASFCVRNPGSVCSNSLNAQVQGASTGSGGTSTGGGSTGGGSSGG
ncbi:MAG TPA: hypothetical protein VNZ26_28395, partial [Vicinamibacterales bacterium]|nr:hypothetical protein [Vicinamibacterales bacterium]